MPSRSQSRVSSQKAGGVARVEKIEMSDPPEIQDLQASAALLPPLRVAIMGKTAPDSVDSRNLIIGDGEAQDWCVKILKGLSTHWLFRQPMDEDRSTPLERPVERNVPFGRSLEPAETPPGK